MLQPYSQRQDLPNRVHAAPLQAAITLAAVCTQCCLGGCVYFAKHTSEGACTDNLGSPIRNFCVEAPSVWRGERPSRDDASWLLDHGVRTVVNLEVFVSDRVAFDHARAPPSARQVQYYHVPDFEPVHLVNWSLLDTHVAHFVAIVKRAPKPVYVHCMDGLDRTGVLIAAYRVLVENVDAETAIAEVRRYGTPWIRVDASYIRSLSGERRDSILHLAAEREARLKPTALINCNEGTCRYSRADSRSRLAVSSPSSAEQF
jgi:protein-tyrosine phosphatase